MHTLARRGLQHFFSYMPSVLAPAAWARFVKGAEVRGLPPFRLWALTPAPQMLLDAFESDPLPKQPPLTDALPLGCAPPGTGVGVKYLTSAKLLRLQLADAAFRRALLLQLLLLVRYTQTGPSAGGPAATHALKPAAADAAAKLAARAQAALAAVPPEGPAVAAAAATVLSRDAAWAAWKGAGCKPFERPPAPEATPAPAPPKAEKTLPAGMRRRAAPVRDHAVKLGVPELDRLWSGHPDLGAAAGRGDRAAPDHLEFMEPIREQLDAAFCADMGIDPEYKRCNDKVFAWRALRLVARANLGAFSRAAEQGGAGLEALARVLFNVPLPAGEPRKEEAAPAAAAEEEPAAAEEAAEEVVAAAKTEAAVAVEPAAEPAGEAAAAEAAAEEAALAEMEAAMAEAEGEAAGPGTGSRKRPAPDA